MIRNMMLGLSLVALSGASAFAAPMVKSHPRAKIVAQAPAADGAKDAKKPTKHVKKAKDASAPKADAPKADAPVTK